MSKSKKVKKKMLRVGVNCTVQFQYAIAVDLNPKLRELDRQGSN